MASFSPNGAFLSKQLRMNTVQVRVAMVRDIRVLTVGRHVSFFPSIQMPPHHDSTLTYYLCNSHTVLYRTFLTTELLT